jgi:hypothetical protein
MPPEKVASIDKIGFGNLEKVVIQFPYDFWREKMKDTNLFIGRLQPLSKCKVEQNGQQQHHKQSSGPDVMGDHPRISEMKNPPSQSLQTREHDEAAPCILKKHDESDGGGRIDGEICKDGGGVTASDTANGGMMTNEADAGGDHMGDDVKDGSMYDESALPRQQGVACTEPLPKPPPLQDDDDEEEGEARGLFFWFVDMSRLANSPTLVAIIPAKVNIL